MDNLKAAFLNNDDFKPHIESIVFPSYKNIWPGSELTFDFPLTLLIGKNGTNKSSILHALYGCPEQKNVGEYWFSTHTDHIEGIDGKRPAYFYRYKLPNTNIIAEPIITRIKDEIDNDLWETSRPILEYGMEAMPKLKKGEPLIGRSKTRWNQIEKEVLYLDFRAQISAFDKAFYTDVKVARPKYREILRKRSRPLKESIDHELQSLVRFQKERIKTNYTFTPAQTQTANVILDADYHRIVYIEHDFFMTNSFSVYVQKGDTQQYSDAFAGSGETSAIRLIYALETAPLKSLILLDEPETSLHIEAQYRLREFIIQKIKEKKLQVVISTHSPFFASGLPECAIKILHVDAETKKIKIINSAPADESSFHLGYKRNIGNKVNVWVEDNLARALTLHIVTEKLTDPQKDKVEITTFSGGASAMYDLAATEMLRPNSNVCFLFDGDKKPTQEIPDPNTIPQAEDNNLKNIIINLFNHQPKFPLDSNNEPQRIAYMRRYLAFARERFVYSDYANPDAFIVENNSIFANRDLTVSPKTILKDYAEEQLSSSGDIKAEGILILQRQLIKGISSDNQIFSNMAEKIIPLLGFAPQA